MTGDESALSKVRIGPIGEDLNPLALGGSVFGPPAWQADARAQFWEAMETALALGVNHFDTASGYGGGQSEELIGEFLQGRRERVFLATKAAVDRFGRGPMLEEVHASLKRLRTDVIDLYYIHWPRRGHDMRPAMEDLELARQQGKVRAVGVSNFSVADMEQVAQVGRIDAHQLGYNLIWRFPEREVIPYCAAHDIAVVTYSSIAQGVLTGKFPEQPQFGAEDNRAGTVHFDADVWPHVYAGVEDLKRASADAGRPLSDLAIRWVLERPFVNTAVVGARTPGQVQRNVAALAGVISSQTFAAMTAISDRVMLHVPDTGNVYRYYP